MLEGEMTENDWVQKASGEAMECYRTLNARVS